VRHIRHTDSREFTIELYYAAQETKEGREEIFLVGTASKGYNFLHLS